MYQVNEVIFWSSAEIYYHSHMKEVMETRAVVPKK